MANQTGHGALKDDVMRIYKDSGLEYMARDVSTTTKYLVSSSKILSPKLYAIDVRALYHSLH